MSETPKSKGGRPSTFTQAMADLICDHLTEGKSLRAICRAADTPNASTILKWLGQYPEFAAQYARAREKQADTLFDEIVGIADEAGFTSERIAKARLQIDARKWVAGKLRPKKYGEKQLFGSDPENPLPTTPVIDVIALAQSVRAAKSGATPADDASDIL